MARSFSSQDIFSIANALIRTGYRSGRWPSKQACLCARCLPGGKISHQNPHVIHCLALEWSRLGRSQDRPPGRDWKICRNEALPGVKVVLP
jgi:hypothetical protein